MGLSMDAPESDAPFELSFGGAARGELEAGHRLGNWTLVSELGAGGMGRVFLAERSDGHYQQRAAVKVLLGWSGAEGLAQLARERQILATLQHPNIARLIDGGTTPMGRPYLVMDYVEGVPIHQHVAAHKLAAPAVLALFQQVLQAVAQAHRQLIVHCDLKPGNVLVTPEGRAMLLDFGIARLQGASGAETLHDVSTFTPRYASPEQKRGAKPGVPSDIYGLGRMLEDLLQLAKAGREKEWRAIVARATADDPDRRYATAAALGDDLRRFAAHRPLAAMPRSPGYVAAKLLRRRWPWALVGVAAVLASAGFTLGLMHERDRAQAAERAALQEAATTRAVSEFVISLFEGADPAVSGQTDMPASVLVQRGRERVDRELPAEPALQAAMKSVLGRVFESIGQPQLAIDLYGQAAALEERADLARPLRQALALSRQAVVLSNQNQSSRAEAPARRALALVEAQGQTDGPELAEVLNTLGIVLSGVGRYDEAEASLQRALGIRSAHQGADSHEAAIVQHNLALVARARGRLDQAESMLRRALAIKRQRLADNHPSVLVSTEVLGRVLNQQRRFADAEAVLRSALELRRKLYGEENEKVAAVLNELANVLQDSGRTADAVHEYRTTVRIRARTLGTQTMPYAIAVNNLATAQEELGQVAEAEEGYRESLRVRQAVLPAQDPGLLRGQHNLGRLLLRSGRAAAARPLIEAATQGRLAQLPEDHVDLLDTLLTQAELEGVEGRADAMAGMLARVQPQRERLAPLRQVLLSRMEGRLATLRGDVAAARSALTQAQSQAEAAVPAQHPERLRTALELAEVLRVQGDAAGAAALLQSVQPRLQAHDAASPLRLQAERLRRALG